MNEGGIDYREVRLALVDCEGREPFEDRGSRVRVRVWGLGLGMVEGDVRGERVDELMVSHESELLMLRI